MHLSKEVQVARTIRALFGNLPAARFLWEMGWSLESARRICR